MNGEIPPLLAHPWKMLLTTTCKNPLLPPPWKNFFRPHARLCVDQGFSNFLVHVSLSVKYVISRHLISAGVMIKLHK